MSKKRTSDESCQSDADEQTHGAASDVPQDEANSKRVKLTPFMNDTTLEDLPFELIESILIKVVAMEVKSMKLAKSVWKEKAELVINRLEYVCSQWSNVLSTDGFRTRLHRALEGQGTIRLEIQQQHTIPFSMSCATALRDEVFVLNQRFCEDDYINVYDWNNVAEVKYVIPLPGLNAERIVACTVSNCVYILNKKLRDRVSILRITGDSVPRWSNVSVVIDDINLPECRCFCVAANGNLVLSREQSVRIPAISVYDANGSLQQKIRLTTDFAQFYEIIPKPNGNLVLRGAHVLDNGEDDDDDYDYDDYDNDDSDDDGDDYDDDSHWQTALTEIDMNGTKIRQDVYSLGMLSYQDLNSSAVDSHGRMMALSEKMGMQLFDSAFNLMELTCPPFDFAQSTFASVVFHYNSERNETIMICDDCFMDQTNLTVFHLEEL